MSSARKRVSTSAISSPHVLLVGGNPYQCRRITRYFSNFDLRVSCARDAAAMQTALSEQVFDLILLDLMRPGEEGIALARELRSRSAMPIIMLSERADDIDQIMSLELGADDYVIKPFNPRELVARIRAVLRRTHAHFARADAVEPVRAFRFAGWELDLRLRRLADANGAETELTHAELALLRVFLEAPRRVLSREELVELSRGHGDEIVNRTVNVLILRLRRKLDIDPSQPDIIKTSRGAGYYFNARARPIG